MSQRPGQSRLELQREAMSRGILQANRNLNFVQRALNPSGWPQLANPDGSYSTHRMAWGTDDHGPVVFPTIVFDPQTNALKQLPDDEAWRHAMRSNEFIRMPNGADADWFSNNGYKLGAGILQQMGSGALAPGPKMIRGRGGLASD